MEEIYNIFRMVWKFISNIFWIACLILLFAFGGVRLFKITPYVITSGSMIPKYPVGSVVYVKPVEIDTLSVGDDITFQFDDSIVATHRIREIDQDNRQVLTYGINNKDSNGNQINDASPVGFDYILGKVVFSLPILGYPYLLIQKVGVKNVIFIVLAIFIGSQLIELVIRKLRRN